MSNDNRQFLAFSLGGDSFAIPVEQIREIIEYAQLTTIPGLPTFLRGLINLRGTVVPVLDLQVRLGKDATQVQRRTCIVIVEVEQEEERIALGILVDAVSEVITLAPEKVEPPPSFGVDLRSDFISGILNLDKRFVVSLDLHNVLSIDELASLIGLHRPRQEG
jgi:purine-binding chemotaxis protein CheW